jgi:hypothetical protein
MAIRKTTTPAPKLDKETIERIIDNLMHTNLYVLDKGTKQYPDYVVGGTEDLKRELLRLIEYKISLH